MSINVANFPTSVWDGSTPNRVDRQENKSPNYEDWDQISAELISLQGAVSAGGNGQVAGTGNTVAENRASVHQTVITFTGYAALVGTTGVGIIGTKIYDFPPGLIRFHGAVANLTISTTGPDIDADAAVVVSVGTVTLADDDTLTGTEADIVPSMPMTLVAGTNTSVGLGVTPATINGTATAVDAYLNIAVPDLDRTDTPQNILVTGTVTITWQNLGDA